MSNRKLDIAFWNYDRCRALIDGSVKIAGVDAAFHSGRIVVDIFEKMVRDRAYDVSELGMTYFLRTMDFEDPPFLAVPVFPVRSFRHSAIYINRQKGIRSPRDLNGKTIGELALYGHDAGVMPKGMLADEYGFQPERCRWIVGAIDFPMDPVDFVPRVKPPNVDVTWADKETDLGQMLDTGEIDALIAADVPKCVLEGSPRVERLFEDYKTVEQDYYRRTGVFPIMHTVVVRKELVREAPDIIRSIYEGFCRAKDAMEQQLVKAMTFNNMTVMLPWLSHLIGENRRVLGKDWWPYGIGPNRKALNAYLRYHYEQGLSKRPLRVEDVFVPSLLDS